MYKRRRLHRPQIPLNAESAITLMQTCDEAFKIYHIFSINGILENEFAVGFMSPKWIHALHQGENRTLIQADATFYVVLSRHIWSAAVTGPAGPSTAAVDGPPLPCMVPPTNIAYNVVIT